jgi:hypothetical protein
MCPAIANKGVEERAGKAENMSNFGTGWREWRGWQLVCFTHMKDYCIRLAWMGAVILLNMAAKRDTLHVSVI